MTSRQKELALSALHDTLPVRAQWDRIRARVRMAHALLGYNRRNDFIEEPQRVPLRPYMLDLNAPGVEVLFQATGRGWIRLI